MGLVIRLDIVGASFERFTVTKHVPSVGFCEFTKATDAATALPQWSGAKVRSGEVWSQALPKEAVGDAKVLVHASPEVVTVVHPRGSGGMTAALQFAEGLASVRWS